MNNSLIEVDSFKNYRQIIKNAVLCLFKDDYILTVTEKRGTVGFPAGKVKKSDKTIFEAMKREYIEETGNNLPKLYNLRRFLYNNKTAIYIAKTNDNVPITLGKNSDGEVIAIKFLKVSDIKKAINNETSFRLRNCVKRSTPIIFDRLGI